MEVQRFAWPQLNSRGPQKVIRAFQNPRGNPMKIIWEREIRECRLEIDSILTLDYTDIKVNR